MAFWQASKMQLAAFRPGIMSAVEIGEQLIMVCMEIAPEQRDDGHEHVFDQCGIVLAGEIEMFIGTDRRLLCAGDCYFIPAGQRHGWRTFAGLVKLFDITLK